MVKNYDIITCRKAGAGLALVSALDVGAYYLTGKLKAVPTKPKSLSQAFIVVLLEQVQAVAKRTQSGQVQPQRKS